MTPVFFKNPAEFRTWLEKHHATESELLVGYYKTNSGKQNMTWPESVDEALCFGWIDGIRRSVDEESYCIRFTPRKPNSIWSAINIAKIEVLTKKGLMQAAGLAAFAKFKPEKSAIYSFENEPKVLDDASEQTFKKNPEAWEFFQNQAPSARKLALHWIMTAKKAETKQSRLQRVIEDCAQRKRLK